jgi:hypothetical protein
VLSTLSSNTCVHIFFFSYLIFIFKFVSTLICHALRDGLPTLNRVPAPGARDASGVIEGSLAPAASPAPTAGNSANAAVTAAAVVK